MPQEQHPPSEPAGERKTIKQAVLATGSRILQNTDPLKGFDVYVVGLHCGKVEPTMQMQAHHYCKQVNKDLLQCAIFDGNTEDANLIGVEYIISEALHDTLPEDEQEYWHPHNFEVFSGQLVAPGLPAVAERSLMETLVNSYGKDVAHLAHRTTGRTGHARAQAADGPGHAAVVIQSGR